MRYRMLFYRFYMSNYNSNQTKPTDEHHLTTQECMLHRWASPWWHTTPSSQHHWAKCIPTIRILFSGNSDTMDNYRNILHNYTDNSGSLVQIPFLIWKCGPFMKPKLPNPNPKLGKGSRVSGLHKSWIIPTKIIHKIGSYSLFWPHQRLKIAIE